ncbi:unnamed protein product [Caretta caretta]
MENKSSLRQDQEQLPGQSAQCSQSAQVSDRPSSSTPAHGDSKATLSICAATPGPGRRDEPKPNPQIHKGSCQAETQALSQELSMLESCVSVWTHP